MRNSTRSRFGSIIRTLSVCLPTALLLASCSKTPREQLLGKWNVDENHSVVDYRKDGTVVSTENGKSTTSKYHFVDNDHLQMDITLGVGTNIAVLHLNCKVAINGDKAELTATIPGNGPAAGGISQTLHYTRAK